MYDINCGNGDSSGDVSVSAGDGDARIDGDDNVIADDDVAMPPLSQYKPPGVLYDNNGGDNGDDGDGDVGDNGNVSNISGDGDATADVRMPPLSQYQLPGIVYDNRGSVDGGNQDVDINGDDIVGDGGGHVINANVSGDGGHTSAATASSAALSRIRALCDSSDDDI
jgi:hypothetical protein